MLGEIKLPNGQTIIDWQYYQYKAWESQIREVKRIQESIGVIQPYFSV